MEDSRTGSTGEKSPTDFRQMGYLADSVERSTADFRKHSSAWVELYLELTRFAQQQFCTTAVEDNNPRHILLYSLLYRGMTLYQTIFLLVERGNDDDSKALLRNLIEIYFDVAATANDKDFAKERILVDEMQRISLLRKAVRSHEAAELGKADLFLSMEQIHEFKQEIGAYEVDKNNPKALRFLSKKVRENFKVAKIAERAGLKFMYDTHYTYLCSYTHPSTVAMKDYLVMGEHGVAKSFQMGPAYKDSVANMRLAMLTMIDMLKITAVFFEMNTPEELASFSIRLESVVQAYLKASGSRGCRITDRMVHQFSLYCHP